MKSFRRLFRLTPELAKKTRWVFKGLNAVWLEVGQALNSYIPDLCCPNDGISDQAFAAFLGASSHQLQIGSSEIGHGKDKPCAMSHLARLAEYSQRHCFRIQAALIELGYWYSDHDAQGLPAKRGPTPQLWARVIVALKRHFKVVPKDIKDPETTERWVQQILRQAENELASQARVKALAEEKPTADPVAQAAHMRTIREILGRGGGDPAPAV